jgi:hypothetical protein
MLLLTFALVLILVTLTAIRGWHVLPTTDRVFVVVVIGYVAMALLLPSERWLSQLPAGATTWFYVGVSSALAFTALIRAFQANPLTPGHRGLLFGMMAVASLPALLMGFFALQWWTP